jgi:hypothetical protein
MSDDLRPIRDLISHLYDVARTTPDLRPASACVAAAEALGVCLDERDALAARLDAVRELHQRVAPEVACIHCGRRWPCPTIRALDNREDPR